MFKTLVSFAALAFAGRAVGVLLLPVYIHWLTPDDFAVLILVTLTAAIIAVFSNLKLDAAMRTFYFDYAGDATRLRNYVTQVMSTSLVSATIILALMLVAGGKLYQAVFSDSRVVFFPPGAIALVTASANACIAPYFVFLRNSLALREFALLQLVLVFGNLSLQLLLIVVFGLGIYGALLGALVPSACVLAFIVARKTGFSITKLNLRLLRPSLKYSTPLIVFSFFYMLEGRLDRYIMEHAVSLEELAAYGVLAGVLGLLGVFLNALDNALRPYFFPELKRKLQQDQVDTSDYYRLYVVSGLLVLSGIIFLGSNLSVITTNPIYLSVAPWFAVGACAFVPVIITRFHSLYYDFHKRSSEVTAWIIVRTGITLVLLIALVPRYEIAGALGSIFVSQLLNAVVFHQSARRKFAVTHAPAAALLPIAVFLVLVWSLRLLIGDAAPGRFGILQFIVVAIVLTGTNIRTLRSIQRHGVGIP